MFKKGLVIGIICILMLVSLPIAICDTQENTIVNNGKHIVYFRGSNYEHATTNNDIINTPFGFFTIFFHRVNDFVRFYFQDMTGETDTKVRIIDNGKPTVYNKDVSIEFDLSSQNSYVIFFTTLKMNGVGFVICDGVSVNDL